MSKEPQVENLIDALLRELNRNRELLAEYENIGAPGMFGATMLRQSIRRAENSISTGNVFEMLQAFEDLKQSK
jgi:hypothetical protein